MYIYASRHFNSFKVQYLWWVAIALTFILGTWLRIDNLGTPSFWLDEAYSVEAAVILLNSNLHDTLTFLFDGSWSGGIVHQYLLAQIINYFGESEATVRLVSVIFGIALIAVLTEFCWHNFKAKAATICAILVSLGYWQIAWSHQAREYILLAFIFWLGMTTIDRIWFTKIAIWIKATTLIILIILATATHLFGMLLVAGILFRWVAHQFLYQKNQLKLLVLLILVLVITALTIYSLRTYFDMDVFWLDIYSSFLLKSYWPLLLLSSLTIFIVKHKKDKEILLWLGLTIVFGYIVIATSIPMVNMRYIFFLTPVLIIFTAVSLSSLFRNNIQLSSFTIIISLTVISMTGIIIWKPASEYILESQEGRNGFYFFTPQPDFRSAYAYIKKNHKNVNLITPYPVISRRYRNKDDILALNTGDSFLYASKKKTNSEHEQYTKVPYATFTKLKLVINQHSNLFFLVDDMYLQRISVAARNNIYTQDKLVRKWVKKPYSSLYLYKIK